MLRNLRSTGATWFAGVNPADWLIQSRTLEFRGPCLTQIPPQKSWEKVLRHEHWIHWEWEVSIGWGYNCYQQVLSKPSFLTSLTSQAAVICVISMTSMVFFRFCKSWANIHSCASSVPFPGSWRGVRVGRWCALCPLHLPCAFCSGVGQGGGGEPGQTDSISATGFS